MFGPRNREGEATPAPSPGMRPLSVESLEIRDTPAAPDLYLNIWVNAGEIPSVARAEEPSDSAVLGVVSSDTEPLDDLVGSDFSMCGPEMRTANNMKQFGVACHHYGP